MLANKYFPRGDGAVNTPAVRARSYYTFPSKRFGWVWVFLIALLGSLIT